MRASRDMYATMRKTQKNAKEPMACKEKRKQAVGEEVERGGLVQRVRVRLPNAVGSHHLFTCALDPPHANEEIVHMNHALMRSCQQLRMPSKG